MPKKPSLEPKHLTTVRYETPEGRRCSKDTPGAIRKTVQSEAYYLYLPPAAPGGRSERVPLRTTDLAVAWHRVREELDRRQKEQLGIIDDSVRQLARPIAQHVEEWLATVAAGGTKAKRVGMLRTRLETLVALAGWHAIGQIRKSSCLAALANLRDDHARGRGSAGRGKGASPQTRNHYLSHARQFTRWLKDEGRLPTDPLAGLKGVSTEEDRRHDRRVPEDLEIRVLFDHLHGMQPTHPPKVRCDMTGPQRALGYQVAMCAGLRAGEVRRLTAESFDLVAGDVTIRATSDKAKKRRRLALPRWLCERLGNWIAAGGQLWATWPEHSPGRLIQGDLARARAGWIAQAENEEERATRKASAVCVYEIQGEDGPLYWDAHSARHWYVTQLAATDSISPSTLQAMTRHADPRLTLEVYARAQRDQQRAVAETLRPGETAPPSPS